MEVELKTIYQVFDNRQETGLWYREWKVEKDFPAPYMFTEIAPPEELKNPKFIWGTGWVEDDKILMTNLKEENASLQERLAKLEEMMNNQ